MRKGVEPVGFAIEFSGEIDAKNIDVGFKSSGPISREQIFERDTGTLKERPNTFFFKWSSPAFTPDKIIAVTVFLKNYVQAIKLVKLM